MRTRAARDGSHYVLTGAKTFVGDAAVDLLASDTGLHPSLGTIGDHGFIVECDTPGPSIAKHIDKAGRRIPPKDLRWGMYRTEQQGRSDLRNAVRSTLFFGPSAIQGNVISRGVWR